jgi:uncharacterized membrane protein
MPTVKPYKRTARQRLHEPMTRGERLADRAAAVIGSWSFLIAQSLFLAFWLLWNTLGFTRHWDSAPYILLNLMLSFQAAFTGPVLLIAANRSASKDHKRDDLEAREVASLVRMNEQQLEILRLLHQLAANTTPLSDGHASTPAFTPDDGAPTLPIPPALSRSPSGPRGARRHAR